MLISEEDWFLVDSLFAIYIFTKMDIHIRAISIPKTTKKLPERWGL